MRRAGQAPRRRRPVNSALGGGPIRPEATLLILCGIFIAFQASAGFLFGQLFAGTFSLPASLTGLCGLATSVGSFLLASKPPKAPPWLRWTAVLALVGVALDIVNYYRYLAIPGNYYPWVLVVPYSACLAWVGYVAHTRRRASTAA